MRNWITFFTILIVQKEFTVSLLCFAFLLQCLERWKGCLKPVLKRDLLKTVLSRKGLMRIAPWCFSCTMRFHLQNSSPRKNFQTRCFLWVSWLFGFSERLGTYLTVILWLKSSLRFLEVMHVTHIEQAPPTSDLFLFPKKMARSSQKHVENVNLKTYEMFLDDQGRMTLTLLGLKTFEYISFLQSMDP